MCTSWPVMPQAGAFQPFFRGHAHHDTKRKEPWVYGEPTTSYIRKAVMARYAADEEHTQSQVSSVSHKWINQLRRGLA
jgi:hypothetical protein